MRNRILLPLMTLTLLFGCTRTVDMSVSKSEVNTVLDSMIDVLETEDMDLLSKIMVHDSDMVNFGTDAGERIMGWEALKSSMELQFAGTESSKLSVRDRVIQVHESGRVAWFSEIIDWNIVYQGQSEQIEGLRGTGVLVKRNGNWLITQLHYSIGAGG